MQIYRSEYPNPQFERKDWINLNGEWDFEIDNSESGLARGILDRPLAQKINVPFCPESVLSGIGNIDFMRSVFYRRTITLTDEQLKDKRVFLHIGACDFEAELFINKKSVDTHYGGYSSFAFDITKFVNAGENIVDIRVFDDTKSRLQGSGKQAKKYQSNGCDYTRTTGIWQTVWLEFTPDSYIKSFKLFPNIEDCSVTAEIKLVGSAPIKAVAKYDGKIVGEASIDSAEYSALLKIDLSEKHLWELGNGRLYDLELTFGDDIVKSYFGLRSVSLDKALKINGKTVFMRTVLDQGFYPDGIYTAKDESEFVKDIEISMAAGFNGARLHQKVFEPRFLYHCDRLGYLVWGEYASWGLGHEDPACLTKFVSEWLEVLERDFNHPAIIGWCPFNETWNAPKNNAMQCRDVLRVTYNITKAYDITRPCIDTSGNYHVVTDIFDLHDYVQDVALYRERYVKNFGENGVLWDTHHARQHWAGEPVFLSEYGGIGLKIEQSATSWSYGEASKTIDEFYERYEGLTSALLDSKGIIGFCYTQLYDIEQEQNGLYTYSREPKIDIARIKAVNERKAAIEE